MDKETYIKRVQEMNHIRQKALEYNRKEMEKAEESYISENCPFKKGDRIKYNGKPGTIEDIKAENDGKFRYVVRLDKKDGTPSLRDTTVYPYEAERIEKA